MVSNTPFNRELLCWKGKVLPQEKLAMLGSLSQTCRDSVVPSGEQLHSNVFWPFLSFCSLTETKLPFQVYLTHKGVLYPCAPQSSVGGRH